MKKYTKILILIGVTLGILTAVFVVSFNHADGKASAEISELNINTEYLVPMQSIPNSTSANWVSSGTAVSESSLYLSGNYTVYVDGITLFSSNLITFARAANTNVQYRLKYSTASATMLLYMLYQNNSWYYSMTGADVTGKTVSLAFSSLTASSTSTGFNPTRFANFKTDLLTLLSPMPTPPAGGIEIQAGYYLINPNVFNELDTSETFDLKARVCQIEYGALGEIPNPLTMSESVTLYDYVAVSVGSGLWIGDDDTLDDVILYNAQSGALQGRFLHVTQDTTIDNKYDGLFVAVPWDLLGYNAYPIAIHYYDTGANDGILNGTTSGVISAIFDGLFGKIFAVEIFPGFPLYIFILIPVVFTILSLVLWLMRGR